MHLRQQLTAACVLVLCACASAKVNSGPPLGPVAIEQRLFRDNASGIRNAEERVIMDSTTWRDVWRLATATQATQPPVPSVDFRQNMLLVVASGRMTIADAVRVDSVGNRAEMSQAGKRVGIVAVYYTITRDCPASTREAFPVEIVRVRRSESTVRFFSRSEAGPGCR